MDKEFYIHPDFRETCFLIRDFKWDHENGFIVLEITWWNTGRSCGTMYEMFDDTILVTQASFNEYKEFKKC